MMFLALLLATTSPITHGAVANDGNDDGAAFRAAIAAACGTGGDHLLDIPAGVFDLAKYDTLSSVPINGCQGLTIKGAGRHATRLRQIPKVTVTSEDLYTFNIYGNAADIELRDLTMDGRKSEMSGPAEQVHLVRVYQVSRLSFRDVTFVESKGDGIKLITATDVTVDNCRFAGLGRGGITFHSGIEDARVTGSTFESISDQYLDFEGGATRRVVISGNSFRDGGNQIKVAISGNGTNGDTQHSRDISVVGNTFHNARLHSIYIDSVAVVGNTFRAASITPVYLYGDSQKFTVTGNVITSGVSCVEVVAMDNGRTPHSDIFANNVCEHATGYALRMEGGTGSYVVDGNVLTGSVGGNTQGLWWQTNVAGVDATGLIVSDNVIKNDTTGVWMVTREGKIDDVSVSGNVFTGTVTPSYSVRHEVWNQSPYNRPWATGCRVDGNVSRNLGGYLLGRWGLGFNPGSTEDCLAHGDAVP